LSYTTFVYSNLKIDKTEIDNSERLIVSIDITNAGKLAGKEAVLPLPESICEYHARGENFEAFEN
jgi:hypothetical protein